MNGAFRFKFARRTILNGRLWWLLPRLCFSSLCAREADEPSAVKAPPSIAEPVPNSVTIPFEFRRSHIVIQARLNESDPLSFMLDTGYSMPMISSDLADTLKLKRVNQVTIVGIAGSEDADVFEGATFDVAGATYAPRRVG